MEPRFCVEYQPELNRNGKVGLFAYWRSETAPSGVHGQAYVVEPEEVDKLFPNAAVVGDRRQAESALLGAVGRLPR